MTPAKSRRLWEIEEKCDRYKKAVGWPRTKVQAAITTEDWFVRTNTDFGKGVVIKLNSHGAGKVGVRDIFEEFQN